MGRRNRSRVRGIDQSLADASQLGKGLGTKLVPKLWLSCCSNDPGSQDPMDPSPSNLPSDPMLRKRGLRGKVPYPDGPAVYMVQTRQAFERTRSVANHPSGGRPRAGALGRPSCQTLNIMREAVIAEVSTQLSEVVGVIDASRTDVAGRTFVRSSAVDGGLKPHSDIDLLVTVTVRA